MCASYIAAQQLLHILHYRSVTTLQVHCLLVGGLLLFSCLFNLY